VSSVGEEGLWWKGRAQRVRVQGEVVRREIIESAWVEVLVERERGWWVGIVNVESEI
jgi:hypothetical protein